MVPLKRVQLGLTNYAEQELASKATGITKFMMYFLLPQIPVKATKLINQWKTNPLFEDLFGENDMVDIDQFYNRAKEAMFKSGQVEMSGIIFNETDLDKLYAHIKEVQM